MLISRRPLMAAAAMTLCSSAFAEPSHDITFMQDFDELWRTLADRHCYLPTKATDWNRVRTLYRPQAEAAASTEAFKRVIASVLAELYDAHTHLADPPAGTPRYPPFDLVVQRDGDAARVKSVLAPSAAALAGLRVGDQITHVGGVPVSRAAAERMPRCLSRPDPEADNYAWNSAVAGRRGQPRRLTTVAHGEVLLPLDQFPDEPNLTWRNLDRDLGYIRIASFGDDKIVASFDQALTSLSNTRGLIVDVRNNGGGDTAVARPIMGRFITAAKPYAKMRRREGRALGAFWSETVEPRGPFMYAKPVVVLCDHWSASMAEGFPMGMRAICGARIVGTPMMGLSAAVFPLRLDRTGIDGQYSAEPVYDVEGRPRSAFLPDVIVPDGKDILAAGIAELRRIA